MQEQVLFSLPLTKLEPIFKQWVRETLFEVTPQQPIPAPDPEPLIFGIKGLSEFLHVSMPTAQRIKNSGRVRYSQAERTIIFNKAEVLEALTPKKR